jgi:hypothetical protein
MFHSSTPAPDATVVSCPTGNDGKAAESRQDCGCLQEKRLLKNFEVSTLVVISVMI